MSQVSTPAEKVHITQTLDVCGGRPCIQGTRIRVQDIYVWHELQGRSPDEIVSGFPQLSLADVYAALAYFWDHRVEILKDLKRQDVLAEEARTQFPSKLPERLKAKASGDAISP